MSEVKRYRKLIGEHPNSAWAYVVRESDFDAQRLRADTAEAELKNVRKSRADELENYNALIADHAAAEQCIANISLMLSRIIEAQKTDYSIRGGLPHRWECLIAEAYAALKPNPEAESHE